MEPRRDCYLNRQPISYLTISTIQCDPERSNIKSFGWVYVTKRLKPENLKKISELDSQTINAYRLGAWLCVQSGVDIETLIKNACQDRMKLAYETHAVAKWAHKSSKSLNRLVITKSYYTMYHAARAIVFLMTEGDDHESHSVLPKHLPKDFPDRARWENELKSARLEGNRADYDAYPRTDRAFSPSAVTYLHSAEDFLDVSKGYLTHKGCRI